MWDYVEEDALELTVLVCRALPTTSATHNRAMASVANERPLPGRGGVPSQTFVEATNALHDAAYRRAVDEPGLHIVAPLLRGRFALRPHTVDLAVDALARDTVHVLLTHGWTPRELYVFAQHRLDDESMSYLVDTLAAAAQVTVAPPWYGELAELGAHVWWTVSQPHIAQWATRHAHKRVGAMSAAVEVLALLCHVPRTDAPLPGAPKPFAIEPEALVQDPRIAGKIDALLARAADQSFPEEARACASKAQELMVRYATVPDIPPAGPVTAAATAAVDQLIKQGPMVVAKTLFSGIRLGTSMGLSMITDPRGFAGTVSDEVASLLHRAVAAITPAHLGLPALPGRGGRPQLDS